VIEIVPERTQQAGQKRWTHPRRSLNDRIIKHRLLILKTSFRKQLDQGELIARRNEAEVNRFVKTKTIESLTQEPPFQLLRLILTGSTRRRQLRTDLVVACMTSNLLDQILFLFYVDTP